MGLFTRSECCPVCGGEVKGLFLTKIANKQALCKACAADISMQDELLKTATPDIIRAHLAYRQKNAELYASLNWEWEYFDIPGMRVGVDTAAQAIYIFHSEMNDYDNPAVFYFDQITGYELYRLTKKVDSADIPGETTLDSGLTALAGIARLAKNDNSVDNDYFKLRLRTLEPYWPTIDLKIDFTSGSLYGFAGLGGFAEDMETVCQMFKHIVRKEPVSIF